MTETIRTLINMALSADVVGLRHQLGKLNEDQREDALIQLEDALALLQTMIERTTDGNIPTRP